MPERLKPAPVENSRYYNTIVRGFLLPFTRVTQNLRYRGQESLDEQEGPLLIAAVHRSNWDIPALAAASLAGAGLQLNFIAKQELWKYRPMAAFINHGRGIPIDRSMSFSKDNLNRIESVADQRGVIGIFPEGTRESGPRVKKIKKGAALLALTHGMNIVPVGIAGTKTTAKMPWNVRVVFGEPIPVEQVNRVGRAEIRQAAEITVELQEHMQHAFDEAMDWRQESR